MLPPAASRQAETVGLADIHAFDMVPACPIFSRRASVTLPLNMGINSMAFLRAIRAWLRGGTSGLCPLEAAILEEAARQLDPERAERLRRRVASINLVQRSDGGREVNTYVIKSGKPSFDDSTRISEDKKVRKFAKFQIVGANKVPYKGSLWSVNGQFFSLNFDKATEHALDEGPISLNLKVIV